jgi:hypothetical protein
MKKLYVLLAAVVLSAGWLRAAEPVAAVSESAAEKAARAEVTKVLAIQDNEKAAEQLVTDLRAMYKDNDGQAAKDGVPELTLALLVKTNFERAQAILPMLFLALTEGLPLQAYERLVAAALLASEASAYAMTEAILNGLEGTNRWIDAVIAVAKDTPRPLPTALMQSIRAISATVLPPAVIPPGPYDGQ